MDERFLRHGHHRGLARRTDLQGRDAQHPEPLAGAHPAGRPGRPFTFPFVGFVFAPAKAHR